MYRGFVILLLALACSGIGHAATNETKEVGTTESPEAMAWSGTWERYYFENSYTNKIIQAGEVFRMENPTTNRYRSKLRAELRLTPTGHLAGREWNSMQKKWNEKRTIDLEPVSPDQFVLRYVVTNTYRATSTSYWRVGTEAARRAKAEAAIIRIETLSDGAPPNWDLKAIARAAPPGGNDGKLHLLAWRVSGEDSTESTGGSCLVVKESRSGFTLAQLYRRDANWRLGAGHFMYPKGTPGYPGLWRLQLEKFDKLPSNKEIYAALKPEDKVGWQFKTNRKVFSVPQRPYQPVTEGICIKTWTKLTGQKPDDFIRELAKAKTRPRPE